MKQLTGSNDVALACPACDGALAAGTVGAFAVWRCGTCGLGRLADMAPAEYWHDAEHGDSASGSELDHPYWTTARAGMFRHALDFLRRDRAGSGRLVDVGGGIGYFADLAIGQGWDAYNLDISPAAQLVAAERIGAERSLGRQDASRFAGTCDAVTLWCVVAHTVEPLDLVADAMALLKPGGTLLVTTPNLLFQGTLARTFARLGRDYDLRSQDHVLHYTPAAARKLLERAGATAVEFRYLGVTDNCIISPRMRRGLVPLKRLWNLAGSRLAPRLGLPPLCAELQIVAKRPVVD